MGKIVKDGFAFVAYANSSLIRKIDDIPELKHKLIELSETKTHLAMSDYAILLAQHILEFTGVERTEELEACFAAISRWQNKKTRFQDALEVAGRMNDLARDEKDKLKAKVFRAMGQIAATPHVRWHPLIASEYAVVSVNLLWPGDMDKVREEREHQIRLMEQV